MSVLAACQPIPPPTAAQPTVTSPDQPRRGGSVRAGSLLDVSSLDGHTLQAQDYNTKWAVYDRLISYDDQVQPRPMLAESWDLSADATQLKLTLRKGVQFHSGRELISDDLKYNFERLHDPKNRHRPTLNAWRLGYQRRCAGQVHRHPAHGPPAAGDLRLARAPEHSRQRHRRRSAGQNDAGWHRPVQVRGTGQGDHMRLVRNDQYWQPNLPYLDEWRVQVVPDPQSIVTQFEAGALTWWTLPRRAPRSDCRKTLAFR
jgi:peptide/nickel transport system substrate-binding protein